MHTRRFGPLDALVPVIGIGTWQMERDERAKAVAAIRAALDAGATHVDTAELYGSGRVEELVAEAIAGRRDQVFLVSKVRPENASYAGTIAACERSLARLKTDRLDCYLLHWRGREPLAETFRAFSELAAAGKIRSFGVSNFDVDDLEEALALVGPGKIACNQVLYHLYERTIEHAVIPWCERHDVAVVGYTPFGKRFPAPGSRDGKLLGEVAARAGVTAHQVALAFLTRRPSLFGIPKTSNAERATANSAAGDLKLSESDISLIDKAFPLGAGRSLPTD